MNAALRMHCAREGSGGVLSFFHDKGGKSPFVAENFDASSTHRYTVSIRSFMGSTKPPGAVVFHVCDAKRSFRNFQDRNSLSLHKSLVYQDIIIVMLKLYSSTHFF